MQPRHIQGVAVLDLDHAGIHVVTRKPLSGSSLKGEGKEEKGNPYYAQ
jgi:hypothetical protein